MLDNIQKSIVKRQSARASLIGQLLRYYATLGKRREEILWCDDDGVATFMRAGARGKEYSLRSTDSIGLHDSAAGPSARRTRCTRYYARTSSRSTSTGSPWRVPRPLVVLLTRAIIYLVVNCAGWVRRYSRAG